MPPPTVFSVKQPWAGLLVAGVKRYESRSWFPTEPGWLLVHASSGKATGLRELAADNRYKRALKAADMEDQTAWVSSAVIGAVKISRVWQWDQPRPKLSKMDMLLCGDVEGMNLWEVSNTVCFRKPLACKGKLNFWRLEGDTLEEYERLFSSRELLR